MSKFLHADDADNGNAKAIAIPLVFFFLSEHSTEKEWTSLSKFFRAIFFLHKPPKHLFGLDHVINPVSCTGTTPTGSYILCVRKVHPVV